MVNFDEQVWSDSRERRQGLLHLRLIPGLRYVQVLVHRGRSLSHVRPDSIEVLQASAVPASELDRDDPLRDDPHWRPVHDLDEATAAGLVPPPRDLRGPSWAEMYSHLERLVSPLAEAGWHIQDRHQDQSWEHGDSVAAELVRGGDHIEVELYDNMSVVVYPVDGDKDQLDGEPTPPLFVTQTEAEARAEFTRRGWSARS